MLALVDCINWREHFTILHWQSVSIEECNMRVLVVDDSTLFRKVVRDVLASLPDVEVVGVAADGEQALQRIESLKPDMVTLDLEMPKLDGLGVLKRLQDSSESPAVVVISAQSRVGAEATTKALQRGAFDFVLKPAADSLQANCDLLRQSLTPIIQSIVMQSVPAPPEESGSRKSVAKLTQPVGGGLSFVLPPEAVVIGVSTGGPAALGELLSRLPANFPKPILIVQHMPPDFTRSLAEQLDRSSRLTVQEGTDGQVCRAGEVYIAPGGSQMGVRKIDGYLQIYVNDDPPEGNCKPAVDYLFRSAAKALGDRCLAMVLTGMGDDGLQGCRLLKQAGAKILVQDEASCVVYGMPRQIVEHSLADAVFPLDRIAEEIADSLDCEVVACK